MTDFFFSEPFTQCLTSADAQLTYQPNNIIPKHDRTKYAPVWLYKSCTKFISIRDPSEAAPVVLLHFIIYIFCYGGVQCIPTLAGWWDPTCSGVNPPPRKLIHLSKQTRKIHDWIEPLQLLRVFRLRSMEVARSPQTLSLAPLAERGMGGLLFAKITLSGAKSTF